MKAKMKKPTIFSTLAPLVGLALLSSSEVSAAVAVFDVQESKDPSPLQRTLSGALRGIRLMHSVIDPSHILASPHIQPTKMKVLFVGLGRTGTTSLVAAMEILGYRCVHDDTDSAVMDLYADYYKGRLTMDQVYHAMGERGFNCSFMYQDYDWAATQDDVKVVFSTRAPEKWVDSWLSVTDTYTLFKSPPASWIPIIRDVAPLLDAHYKDIPTGGNPQGWQDRDTLLKGYRIHQENVMQAVPKERLLVYSVEQGWEPFCQFLGVPVPESLPFPHVNDRLTIAVTIHMFRVIGWIWPLALILPLWLVCMFFRIIWNRGNRRVKADGLSPYRMKHRFLNHSISNRRRKLFTV